MAAQRKGLLVLGFWSFRLSGLEVGGGVEEASEKVGGPRVFTRSAAVFGRVSCGPSSLTGKWLTTRSDDRWTPSDYTPT